MLVNSDERLGIMAGPRAGISIFSSLALLFFFFSFGWFANGASGLYAVVLARTSVLSRPGIFITPWVNDCGSSAQGFSAGIALPPVGNIFTSFFNHSTGCLQPVFGEESHLPTCNVPSRPALQLHVQKDQSGDIHGADTDACQDAVRQRLLKTSAPVLILFFFFLLHTI